MKTTWVVLFFGLSLFAEGPHISQKKGKNGRAVNEAPRPVRDYHDTQATHKPHWGYPSQVKTDPGIIPPSRWHEINEDCREGRETSRQSPINITIPVKTPDNAEGLPGEVETQYSNEVRFDVFHNRHAVQATVNAQNSDSAKRNTVNWKGTSCTLKQFHIHVPSEHLINGKAAPMEIHFVHQSPDEKSYTVLGVMVELAEQSSVQNLQSILRAYDPNRNVENPVQVPIHPKNLFPQDMKHYVSYNGSLTTPPCSENVNWVVFQDTLKLTQKDIDTMKAQGFGVGFENARPVQKTTKVHDLKYHLK